jgi:eukaryotic-like serine/threonine-protein kinase
MGMLAYLSPEVARGEEIDSRSDIFSLGAVMCEMATAGSHCTGRPRQSWLTPS